MTQLSLPQHIQAVQNKAICLYSKNEVEAALDKMARAITERLEGTNPLILCVMIGGLIPAGSLLLRLNFQMELDYIHATRYRSGLTGGEIQWKVTPSASLKDRTVLIVDDILDGGITLQAIVDYCKAQSAREVLSAVLVDKKEVRLPGGLAQADFTGLEIGNYYIFGYGMDYKEYLRNLPGIYMLAPEHMESD